MLQDLNIYALYLKYVITKMKKGNSGMSWDLTCVNVCFLLYMYVRVCVYLIKQGNGWERNQGIYKM